MRERTRESENEIQNLKERTGEKGPEREKPRERTQEKDNWRERGNPRERDPNRAVFSFLNPGVFVVIAKLR